MQDQFQEEATNITTTHRNPFAPEVPASQQRTVPPIPPSSAYGHPPTTQPAINARSNSITGGSVPESPTRTFSSFLSRATSVTTSSVTDRLGGAVGSVKSAVGSLSSQLQQVPSNLERFSGGVTSSLNQQLSTTTNMNGSDSDLRQASSSSSTSLIGQSAIGANSANSPYMTNTATATANATQQYSQPSVNPVISRQRVLLVIDGYHTDWSKHFKKAYQRSTSGSQSGTQSAASSLFSSFASAASDSAGGNMDLAVEQADFREISVLANSSLATVPTVYINSSRTSKSTRIVKPDYVVVRQRTKDRLDHFRNIVIGLNYGRVPMLESLETWQIFQDKSWIFSHLAQIQQRLGREHFQLIPQIYCQTHQELVHQINAATITYPCLVRLGSSGRGKIKVDNGQILLELASIVAMCKTSCTIEPFIDARCDLLIQKIGQKSIRAFARKYPSGGGSTIGTSGTTGAASNQNINDHANLSRRISWNKTGGGSTGLSGSSASTGVGSSIFATLQSTAGGTFSQAFGGGGLTQQQLQQQQQQQQFEPIQLADKHKRWVETISEHFQERGGLEMFSIKALISNKDGKEFIIGMSNCAMDLMSDTAEEDRRSVAELVVAHMNQTIKMRSDSIAAAPSYVKLTQNVDQQQQHPQPTRVPSLTGRSQSVSVGSDAGLTRPPLPRRGSREPCGSSETINREPPPLGNASSFTNLTTTTTSGATSGSIVGGDSTVGGQSRQSVSSFMDQTQSALSSFQNRSMNFFRRLDSRQESFSSFLGSSSASGSQDKLSGSDSAISSAPLASTNETVAQPPPVPTSLPGSATGGGTPPPKPPPPANRPHPPLMNSISSASSEQQQVGQMDKQMRNQGQSYKSADDHATLLDSTELTTNQDQSGSSVNQANLNQEQQNGEAILDDTMKNLRKTFAGIFGDM